MAKQTVDYTSTWWNKSTPDEVETDPSLGKIVASSLTSTVKLIRDETKIKQYQDVINMRLYQGLAGLQGLTFGAFTIPWGGLLGNYGSLSNMVDNPAYNLVYSATETIVSKIIKSQPRPEVLPSGGSYDLAERSELLQDYCDGVFYDTNLYAISESIIRNAVVFGTGIIKVFIDEDNKLNCKSIFPSDIWVAGIEINSELPRSMYETMLVDRYVLIEQFPDKEEELLAAKPFQWPSGGPVMDAAVLKNLLLLQEGWHLPSGKKAKDGLHAMSCNDILLEYEQWDEENYPFVFLRYNKLPLGFWGRGVAELLRGHQTQLNFVLAVEGQSHAVMSLPRIWVDGSSTINVVQMDDTTPGIIGKYLGSPPTATTWQATSTNFVEYKNWIIQSAFEFLGISEMSSQAIPPEGIKSGVALREILDTEQDRFTSLGMAWDSFFIDVTKKMISCARNIKGYSVNSSNGYFLKKVKWSDIDLADDSYNLQIFPTSNLPTTPAGRKEFVQELAQAQWIDQDTALDLLNIPDLKGYMKKRNASLQNLKRIINDIIKFKKYTAPDETDNLTAGITLFTQAYQLALTCDDVTEESKKLLRQWIVQAKNLLQPPPPPQPDNTSPGSPAGPQGPIIARGPRPPVGDLNHFSKPKE